MAVGDNPKGFRPKRSNARIEVFPEAATQSFKRGDMVIQSSGVAIALAASAELMGVAAQDATGTTGSLIPVYCDPDEVFIGRTDAADALAVGGSADIIGGAGAMQIDANGGSTAVLVAVGEVDWDQADAIGKEYLVQIQKHALAETSS